MTDCLSLIVYRLRELVCLSVFVFIVYRLRLLVLLFICSFIVNFSFFSFFFTSVLSTMHSQLISH